MSIQNFYKMFNQVQNVVKRTSDEVSGGTSSVTGRTGVAGVGVD